MLQQRTKMALYWHGCLSRFSLVWHYLPFTSPCSTSTFSFLGAALPTQAAVNVNLSDFLGSPIYAAWLSFVISAVILSPFCFFNLKWQSKEDSTVIPPPLESVKTLLDHILNDPSESVLFLGGIFAAAGMITMLYIIPFVGIGFYIACYLVGQIFSSVWDEWHRHQVLRGFNVMGLLIVLTGVVVFQLSDDTDKIPAGVQGLGTALFLSELCLCVVLSRVGFVFVSCSSTWSCFLRWGFFHRTAQVCALFMTVINALCDCSKGNMWILHGEHQCCRQ